MEDISCKKELERKGEDTMSRISWAVLIGGGICLAGMFARPGFAQSGEHRQPLPDQQTFSVDEAISYGLVHNPGLRSIRKLNQIAEGEVISASILQNSAISIAFARSRSRTRSGGGEAGHGGGEMEGMDEDGHEDEGDEGGHEEEGDMEMESDEGGAVVSRSRTVAIAQRFDIAGQRPLRILRARANLDRVRLQIAEAEIELVRNLKRACAEYVALTDEMAEIHNVMYAAKPVIWDATADQPNDRLRAMVEFMKVQQDSRLTRQSVMRAEAELNTLLGLPPDTRLLIAGTIDPEPIPIPYQELKKSILSRNLSIQIILAELRGARFGLNLAMQDKVPGVDAAYSNTRTNSGGDTTRSNDIAIGLSVDFFRQIVEQNRAEVLAAKGAIEFTENALQHARWELENELYALYQDMNLARSRIRVLDDGYLPHLRQLVEIYDPEDYAEGRIELNTWLQDVMRYHMDGETMLALKAGYTTAFATLEFLAGGSFFEPIPIPLESDEPSHGYAGYWKGLATKAGRGVGNIVLAPLEIPAGWYGYIRDRGVFGVIAGPFEGTVTFVERASAGALDLLTAPAPWPIEKMEPVSRPVWGKNPWTNTWSLAYIHPAAKYTPEFNDETNEISNTGGE